MADVVFTGIANIGNVGGDKVHSKRESEGAGKGAKTPRTGPEWDEYFRSKYGDQNVDWKTSLEYTLYGIRIYLIHLKSDLIQ